MKTCELFRDHTVLSFEIFPPKPTVAGNAKRKKTTRKTQKIVKK